jgi:molybdopterin-guanine dinucleotide biosynthesis protein A
MNRATLVTILAGGASGRMGRDKALIVLDGRTILARLADAARDAALEAVVVGRAALPGYDTISAWLEDERPGEGPLAALATALRHARERGFADVLLVACDMPLVDRASFAWLAERPLDRAQAVVVERDRGREPLFARYANSALPVVTGLLDAGERSLGALLDSVTADVVEAPAWLAARLANVNTVEDLSELAEATAALPPTPTSGDSAASP